MMKKYLIFDLDGTLIDSNNVSSKDFELKIIKKIDKRYVKKAKHVFETTPGKSLRKQIKKIFESKQGFGDDEVEKLMARIYKGKIRSIKEVNFFKGVKKKIKKLSKVYKLYLTTGNSTNFAEKILERGGVFNCFEIIYGSDKVDKGHKHLEEFERHSEDENFYKNSLYLGDGNMDGYFAKQKGIDFVHIDSRDNDKQKPKDFKYNLKSIVEIDTVLKKFNTRRSLFKKLLDRLFKKFKKKSK